MTITQSKHIETIPNGDGTNHHKVHGVKSISMEFNPDELSYSDEKYIALEKAIYTIFFPGTHLADASI